MIHFVVPAYNEEANIVRLIEETDAAAREYGLEYRLIVVDDGSSDRTAELVRQKGAGKPVELVSYRPNRGVAEAFRQGLHKALERASDEDRIVTKEADGTSDLGILPELLAKSRRCDVALASCYAPGGGIENTTWLRMLMSRAANSIILVAFGMRGIHTYSSFYRVYRPKALRAVLERHGDFFAEPGFASVVELLVRLKKAGMRMEEVPMVLRSERRIGKSKMKIGRTIAGYFRVIGRNLFR